MRVLVGLLIVVAAGACTSGSTSDTTAAILPDTPPASIITDQLLAELDLEGLAASVSRLRELEFLELVPVQIIEDADYRARVAELTAPPLNSTPDAQSAWLRLLGALPDGADTPSARSRLLQTTVAFYDDGAGRILVRSGAGVDPYVESVVVHELVHALQHQHFGRADTRFLDGDQGYVYEALVEGDAQRVTRRFIGELSQADEFAYEAGRLTASESVAAIRDSTPRLVLEWLSQPADDGVRFLQGTDYEVVNGFFSDLEELSSLPPSSEAIIVPEADLDSPSLVLLPPTVAGYERVSNEPTLGLGRLRLLLGQVVDPSFANRASLGWAADRIEVWMSDDDVIFSYLFAGERVEDAEELAAAFESLFQFNLVAGAYGSVRVADDQVLVVAAADPTAKARLDELYGDFGEEVVRVPPG